MKGCKIIRFFDIFFAILGIISLSPIFLIVSLLLALSGEHKILYFQSRVGLNCKSFKIIKFVTMLENSPEIGNKSITFKNDPRILPFGNFLRQSKINELPQLINVILGDMSLVGPRPLTEESFYKYSNKIQTAISKVRPGITGAGSIIFRNEENFLSKKISKKYFFEKILPYKGELEIWFIENKSLKLYFLLIFLTLFLSFFKKSSIIIFRLIKNIPKPSDEIKYLFY